MSTIHYLKDEVVKVDRNKEHPADCTLHYTTINNLYTYSTLIYCTVYNIIDGANVEPSRGPYISLLVVTKHISNPGLLNTKFRLDSVLHVRTQSQLHTIVF